MNRLRAQRTWINLSTKQKKYNYSGQVWGLPPRRRKVKGAKWLRRQHVVVQIINAITGETTKALADEPSNAKLKKWLKIRNTRAEFEDMIISPKSTWALLADDQWKDFPIIVKVGTYQTSYVIDHIGTRHLTEGKSCVTVYLKTVGNVDYLSLIKEKKELVEKVRASYKVFKKTK